ncbi:MAG: hypothetical protein GY856_03595 [bacterium]|nr:hypothetical protein [bacterium]
MNASDAWKWAARYEHRTGEEDLRQGDLICVSGTAIEAYFRRSGHLVVLNQSCDLARRNEFSKGFPLLVSRARTLLAAPVVRVKDFFAAELAHGKKLSNVARFRQSLWWNHSLYAYLPPSPDHEVDEHLLVVLEELYTLELWHVADGVPNLSRYDEVLRSPRVGLASPWAERIGWMVGSMFARIGTPDPSMDDRKRLEDDVAANAAAPASAKS